MGYITFLILSSIVYADQNPTAACLAAHNKAVISCSAHEQAVSADALTIVSSETRDRVVDGETQKLKGLMGSCRKLQESCALTCDEAVETATLGGEDVSTSIEHLSDCRQGTVVHQLEAMNRKLEDLKRMQSIRPEKRKAISSASNQ